MATVADSSRRRSDPPLGWTDPHPRGWICPVLGGPAAVGAATAARPGTRHGNLRCGSLTAALTAAGRCRRPPRRFVRRRRWGPTRSCGATSVAGLRPVRWRAVQPAAPVPAHGVVGSAGGSSGGCFSGDGWPGCWAVASRWCLGGTVDLGPSAILRLRHRGGALGGGRVVAPRQRHGGEV
jgi:hypothetical protein